MLVYCWPTVCDAGPTVEEHFYLMGRHVSRETFKRRYLQLSTHLRDAPFDIWRGGGEARKNMKKSLSLQKSEKKFVENVGRKEKFVVKIDKNYVDQKKLQIVAYIIDKKKIFHLPDETKKIVGRSSPKKKLFSRGGKK